MARAILQMVWAVIERGCTAMLKGFFPDDPRGDDTTGAARKLASRPADERGDRGPSGAEKHVL